MTLICFLCSCAANTGLNQETVLLPSGGTVVIESVTTQYFPGDKSTALIVKYISSLDLTEQNEAAIKKQAKELVDFKVSGIASKFKLYENFKEKQIKKLVLMALDKPKPEVGMYTRKSYGVLFDKDDNNWQLTK